MGRYRLNWTAVRCCEMLARTLLLGAMLGLLLLLGRGVIGLFLTLLREPDLTETLLKVELIRSLTLLAVFEVYRTVQTYFAHGRVKVTSVLETILVALSTELLALSFRGVSPLELAGTTGAVLALLIARILAIRYSPDAHVPIQSGWLVIDERAVPL